MSRQSRLSEVAKHLIVPKGITGSYWPEVYDICTEKMGIEFDGWQAGAGGLILAHRANGRLAHTVDGVGMSICRQTGKTFLLASLLFGLCATRPGLLCIWSAHHARTHNETFISLQGYANRLRISPYVQQIYRGSGVEEIRFVNGSRILFGARERGFGRGIAAVDVMVMDEGQILSERAMQNMVAMMNVSLLGLHIYCGTPPKPEDNSESFLRMRDEALSGESADILWIEFGADDDAKLDDQHQWAKANPSFPHRTPIESIKRLRKKLGDDGFRREALGIYDSEDSSVFDLDAWQHCADLDVDIPSHVALSIDVSPDRAWSSIAVAGEVGERTLIMNHSIRGTSKVVPKVVELMDNWGSGIIDVSLFSGGQARVLEPDMVQADIPFERMYAADAGAAQAALQEAVKAHTIVHLDQTELNLAVANAKTRYLQSGESEQIDRRERLIDLSPVVACSNALYRFGLTYAPLPAIF